jgi:HEPN domain-containing protein
MNLHEDRKRALVGEWLERADEDLNLARHLLSEGMYLRAVGFHAQQAAEKYLKAFLILRQVDFPKTHAIGKLLDYIAHEDKLVAESLRALTELSRYGVTIRYPGDLPDVSLEDACRAVELGGKAADEIHEIIARETGQ